MKWVKELIAGLLAGTLLACLAFPSGVQSLGNTLAALFACLLSIAVTSATLWLMRWPRLSAEIRLSTLSLLAGGALLSIGLGIFLWRLTLRVNELFGLGVPLSALLVFVAAFAYLGLCHYLLMSYLASSQSTAGRVATYQPLLREANRDLGLEARRHGRPPGPQKRPAGRS